MYCSNVAMVMNAGSRFICYYYYTLVKVALYVWDQFKLTSWEQDNWFGPDRLYFWWILAITLSMFRYNSTAMITGTVNSDICSCIYFYCWTRTRSKLWDLLLWKSGNSIYLQLMVPKFKTMQMQMQKKVFFWNLSYHNFLQYKYFSS